MDKHKINYIALKNIADWISCDLDRGAYGYVNDEEINNLVKKRMRILLQQLHRRAENYRRKFGIKKK